MCHVIQYDVLYIERAWTKHKTKPCVGPNQWTLLQILLFAAFLCGLKKYTRVSSPVTIFAIFFLSNFGNIFSNCLATRTLVCFCSFVKICGIQRAQISIFRICFTIWCVLASDIPTKQAICRMVYLLSFTNISLIFSTFTFDDDVLGRPDFALSLRDSWSDLNRAIHLKTVR